LANKKIKSTVLTIAGFDPSGGAGILADIKTISSLGSYGVAAITAITYQNTREVRGTYTTTADALKLQLETLLDDITINALKTGMLGTKENVEIISDIVSNHSLRPLVIDPVIISSSGYPLLEEKGVNTLKKRLIPLAEIITPNLLEASALSGMDVKNVEQMKEAAKAMFDLGVARVLITGGHLEEKPTDLLYEGREFTFFEGERIEGIEAHGLGCHFSAALATLLSQGLVLKEAIKKAKTLISISLKRSNKIGKGRVIPNIFFKMD
jgi:hydroxymethylpyrimidine kinase/phosphomethylpyrimidine kinase